MSYCLKPVCRNPTHFPRIRLHFCLVPYRRSHFFEQQLWFPFLLGIFFVLNACRFYYDVIPLATALKWMGIYTLYAGGLLVLFRLLLRHWHLAAVAALVGMLLLFYWPRLADSVKELLGPNSLFARLPVLALIVAAAAFGLVFAFARAATRTQRRVVLFLNLTTVAYIVVEAIRLVALGMGTPHPPEFRREASTLQALQPRPGPPVYILLFDEYASTPSLQRYWGFDNSPMDSFLRAQGFSIQHGARSNYPFTFFSLASMLNLGYLDTPTQEVVRLPDYYHAKAWADSSAVAALFKRGGYQIYNFSFFNIQGQQLSMPRLYSGPDFLLTAHTLPQRFLKDYWPILAFGRYKEAVQKARAEEFYSFYRYNEAVAQLLADNLNTRNDLPQLIYAHFLMPHDPYYFDDSLRLLPLDSALGATIIQDLRGYHNNIRKANTLIREYVPRILQKHDGNAIILIIGDHGCRIPDENVPASATLKPLNAVYFPDQDYSALYDSITNVNTMRILCRKALSIPLPLLPDRSYLPQERP